MARFWCNGWVSPHRIAVGILEPDSRRRVPQEVTSGVTLVNLERQLVRILKAAATPETLDLAWPLRVITHGGEEPRLPIPTLASPYVSPWRGHNFGQFPGQANLCYCICNFEQPVSQHPGTDALVPKKKICVVEASQDSSHVAIPWGVFSFLNLFLRN